MNTRKLVARMKAEMATVRRVRALRAAGKTFRDVAAALNDAKVPSKRGGRWSAASVGRLLVRWEVLADGPIMREPLGPVMREPLTDIRFDRPGGPGWTLVRPGETYADARRRNPENRGR